MRLSLNYKVAVSSSRRAPGERQGEKPVSQKPESIDVQKLLAGQSEVRLVHRGEEYRLRITRQGKLLLTK